MLDAHTVAHLKTGISEAKPKDLRGEAGQLCMLLLPAVLVHLNADATSRDSLRRAIAIANFRLCHRFTSSMTADANDPHDGHHFQLKF